MRNFWRKPLVIGLLLVSATLLCISGSASAKVTDVQIQSPTEAVPYPSPTEYVKPGTDVTVTAVVTVDATADVWMNATIGGSTIAASKVGSITVPGSDPMSAAFSVTITLGSGESDGWKNVMVQAYAQADGITLSDTEAKAVRVDATAPSIGPWSPADASFANITTQTFVVPVSDAASGVNWSGIGIASVDVSGGVLDSVSYNIGAGTVTIAVKDMNAPGAKSVTLRVSDRAGNQATSTQSFTIVDSAKPTMGAWDINGTGVADGVWIPTSSATFGEQITDAFPSLGITSVTARRDGGSATPVPHDTGNRYAISFSGMSDGAHTLEFTATDGSGNSQSATLNFNVGTVDPVIDGDSWSPASSSWVPSSSATITVKAADSGSGIDGATANAWIDPVGPTVSASYASGSGKIIVDVSGLAEGDYTLYVSIKDKVGHTAATKSMTFKVDLGGPVFANAFPSNGLETKDTGIAPHIDITDSVSEIKSDSIIWTMTALGGGSVGGARLWSDPTSTYTPSVALAADGTYTLGVSARNNADLLSTYPASPDTWTFLLDTVAPSRAEGAVIADLGPSPRTIGTEQFTADTTPTVWVQAWDDLGGSGFNNDFSPSSIEIKVYSDASMGAEVSGSTTAGTRPLTNDEEWEATWVPDDSLDDGDYYYQVIATDDAGNEGTITDPSFKFTVDTTAPTDTGEAEVGSVNAANSKRFTNNPEVAIAWAASTDPATGGAPGSGLIGYKLEIWTKATGDSVPTGTKVYAASGTYDAWLGDSFVAPCGPPFGLTEYYTTGALTLISGTSYGAWIKAFDSLGNASAWFDPPFMYDSDAPSDPGTPLVVGISPAGEIASHAPEFQWAHSSDEKTGVPQSGVSSYEFQIKRVGGTVWDVFATVIDIDDEDVDLENPDSPLSGDFVWTLPSPYTLGDGGYVARVRSCDVAGNYSIWVESAQFEVDTTPPPIPGIPTTTGPTNSQTPDWTWNPRDDMSAPGETPASYNVYLDDKFIENVTTNAFVASDYASTVLSEGRHELQVTALDAVGNESARSATGHVVIDITKPETPTTAALPPYNRTNTVTFTWTAVSDAVSYTLTPSKSGDPQSPIQLTLTSYSLDVTTWGEGDEVGAVVIATDDAGNESDPSNEASTVIDRVKPTVTEVTTPPTPTTDTRPKWEWEATDTGGSGVAHCGLTLDEYEPIEAVAPVSTFTPEFNLPDGIHVLRVVAVGRGTKAPNSCSVE